MYIVALTLRICTSAGIFLHLGDVYCSNYASYLSLHRILLHLGDVYCSAYSSYLYLHWILLHLGDVNCSTNTSYLYLCWILLHLGDVYCSAYTSYLYLRWILLHLGDYIVAPTLRICTSPGYSLSSEMYIVAITLYSVPPLDTLTHRRCIL